MFSRAVQIRFVSETICFLLVVLCFFAAPPFAAKVFGQTPTVFSAPPVGEKVEREIKGGERHVYKFVLNAGEFARVEVLQKNINLAVALFDADGKPFVAQDTSDGRVWRVALSVIAARNGEYQIEIKSHGAANAAGSYSFLMTEKRAAAPEDEKRLAAEARFAAARCFHLAGGKHREAVAEYEAAAAIWREIGDDEWEAVALTTLGRVKSDLGEDESALAAHARAAELLQKTGDQVGEGMALIGSANSYTNLSQYGKASDFFEKALRVRRGINDRRGEAFVLQGLGNVNYYLSQYEKARDYYEQALAIFRELKERRSEGQILNSLGTLSNDAKQYQAAKEFYLQALPIRIELKDRRGEAFTRNGLGNVYFFLRQFEQARKFYEEALAIRLELNDPLGLSDTFHNLGETYFGLRQYGKARRNLEQALAIRKQIKDGIGVGETCSHLMRFYEKLKKPELAIVYGKQAINAFQQIRADIKNLDQAAQQSFVAANTDVYRRLADLLISVGRLLEAQTVLDLLKEEEYRQISRSGENAEFVPFSPFESTIIAAGEKLAALTRERDNLNSKKSKPDTTEELKLLEQKISEASKTFDAAVNSLGAKTSDARISEIKSERELQIALKTLAQNTKSGVAALYTVLGIPSKTSDENRILNSKFGWVILVTENDYKSYPINVVNLENEIFDFRRALSSDRYDPLPLAQKIHNRIFRQISPQSKTTLEADLKKYFKSQRDKTLMWSLDGVLRYIPIAALHDGRQYLLEKYRSTIFNKNSLPSLTEENQPVWKALGFGVSDERDGFEALPGVKTELETIVRDNNGRDGILPGEIRLNGNFTKKEFFKDLDGAFPVVHVASHYSFNAAGNQDESFLLVGDGRLTLGEMKRRENLFKNVDLLTLSACETALSENGIEAESLPFNAQRLGAKSVLASLWKVADAGTLALMVNFYKLRNEKPALPKAEAFRQAQLSLLKGERKTGSPELSQTKRAAANSEQEKPLNLSRFRKEAAKPFAHPFYWSPFVLFGNWR